MKILVVEDEYGIRKALEHALEAELFTVDLAKDGKEGAYMGRVNPYDLIVLDINLPEKDGLDICRELRDEGKTTPILIVSVRSEVTKKIDLLNAGADDYLTKPFSMQELLARVKALLRRPQQIKSDVVMIDDLVLDSKKHFVKRGSREIHLTRKEFMLLEYLIKNQGTVLSRGMIMEHVWDMSVDPFSNTIESHITSLRRKIDTDERKLIHTISGRGYTMR